jgi:hypothetical protein
MTTTLTELGTGMMKRVARAFFGYALLALSLLITTTTINSSTHTFAQTSTSNYYENTDDGFRVQVPDGWVIEDIDNTDPARLPRALSGDTDLLARLCRSEDALPGIGGTYECGQVDFPDKVTIFRNANLHSRPEFATILRQNKSITLLDLVSIQNKDFSGSYERLGLYNLRVSNMQDRTVNVINSQTNMTTAQFPAKFVVFTYEQIDTSGNYGNGMLFNLYVLGNNTNTGYSVRNDGWNAAAPEPSSPDVKQIMDSFELIE